MKLEKNQKQAVEFGSGPALLLAGPGTGKTFTLENRIKYLVENEYSPNEILGLTFSESAANELKSRLSKKLDADEDEWHIFTFHGFANWLIENNPERFNIDPDYFVATDVDKLRIVREALEALETEYLATQSSRDRGYYVEEVKNKISTIKKEGITEEAYFNILKQRKEQTGEELEQADTKTEKKSLRTELRRLGRLEELWNVFEYYQEQLAELGAIDYQDMINAVLEEFRTEKQWRQEIADQFEYVLVDEYQDTNQTQNELVFQITKHSDNDNIMVVGDDDQSIYGFQGASLRNVLDFIEHFPDAEIITLEANFRSSQKVLDLANTLIQEADSRLIDHPELEQHDISKALKAKKSTFADSQHKPLLVELPDRESEIAYIVKTIQTLTQEQNISFDDIAVLTRTNNEGREISRALFDAGIPHAIGWSEDILQNPVIVQIIATLSSIYFPEDSESFFAYLMIDKFKNSLRDVVEIAREAKKRDITMRSTLEILLKDESHSFRNVQSLQNAHKTLQELEIEIQKQSPSKAVTLIDQKLGLSQNIHSDSDITQNSKKTLRKKIKEFADRPSRNSLRDFTEFLNLAENYQIRIQSEKTKKEKGAVSVITAHGAKGTEFRVVFVTQLTAKRWEDSSGGRSLIPIPKKLLGQAENTQSKFTEELKLLYVSLTRAKERLFLTHPLKVKNQLQIRTTLLNPALNTDLMKEERIERQLEKPTGNQNRLFTENLGKDYRQELKALIKDYNWSASGLGLFRSNRQRFKYEKLYNLPQETKINQYLGQTLHETLKEFVTKSVEDEGWKDQDWLLDYFSDTWWKTLEGLFPEADIAAKHEDGLAYLSETHEHMTRKSVPEPGKYDVEAKFESKIEDIPIRGKIDYYEIKTEGVEVTDYKSGRVRSKSHIKGETKSGDGRTFDQLAIYKILLEDNLDRKVTKGKILYLQDPEKERVFNLDGEDVEQVKQKVQDAKEKAENLDFEPKNHKGQTQTTEEFPKLSKLGL